MRKNIVVVLFLIAMLFYTNTAWAVILDDDVRSRLESPPTTSPPPHYSDWTHSGLEEYRKWYLPVNPSEYYYATQKGYWRWPMRHDASTLAIANAFYWGKYSYDIDLNIDKALYNFWSFSWATFDYRNDPVSPRIVKRKWAVNYALNNITKVWVDITNGKVYSKIFLPQSNYVEAYAGERSYAYAYSTSYWTAGKLDPVASKPNLRSFVTAPTHVLNEYA